MCLCVRVLFSTVSFSFHHLLPNNILHTPTLFPLFSTIIFFVCIFHNFFISLPQSHPDPDPDQNTSVQSESRTAFFFFLGTGNPVKHSLQTEPTNKQMSHKDRQQTADTLCLVKEPNGQNT